MRWLAMALALFLVFPAQAFEGKNVEFLSPDANANVDIRERDTETSGVPSFGLSTHNCLTHNAVSGGGFGIIAMGIALSTANEDCQKMKLAEMYHKILGDTRTAKALMDSVSFMTEVRIMPNQQGKIPQTVSLGGAPPTYHTIAHKPVQEAWVSEMR